MAETKQCRPPQEPWYSTTEYCPDDYCNYVKGTPRKETVVKRVGPYNTENTVEHNGVDHGVLFQAAQIDVTPAVPSQCVPKPEPVSVYIPPQPEEPTEPPKPPGPPMHFCSSLGEEIESESCFLLHPYAFLSGAIGTSFFSTTSLQDGRLPGFGLSLLRYSLNRNKNFFSPSFYGVDLQIEKLATYNAHFESMSLPDKVIPATTWDETKTVTEKVELDHTGHGPNPSSGYMCPPGYESTGDDCKLYGERTRQITITHGTPEKRIAQSRTDLLFDKLEPRYVLRGGFYLGKDIIGNSRFRLKLAGFVGPSIYLSPDGKYHDFDINLRGDALAALRIVSLLWLTARGGVGAAAGSTGVNLGAQLGGGVELYLGVGGPKKRLPDPDKKDEPSDPIVPALTYVVSPPESGHPPVVLPPKGPTCVVKFTFNGMDQVDCTGGTPPPQGPTITDRPPPDSRRREVKVGGDQEKPKEALPLNELICHTNQPRTQTALVKADRKYWVKGKPLRVNFFPYTHTSSHPLVSPLFFALDSPLDKVRLSRHQLEEYVEMVRQKAKVVLSENLISDKPLTSADVRRGFVNRQKYVETKSVGQLIEKYFPNGIPEVFTPIQRMVFAEIGSARFYAATHKDVILLPASSINDEKIVSKGRALFSPHSKETLPFLKSEKITDLFSMRIRENLAAKNVIKYLKDNPNEPVYISYGNAHNFERAFANTVDLTSYSFPAVDECDTHFWNDGKFIDKLFSSEGLEAYLTYYEVRKNGINEIRLMDAFNDFYEQSKLLSDYLSTSDEENFQRRLEAFGKKPENKDKSDEKLREAFLLNDFQNRTANLKALEKELFDSLNLSRREAYQKASIMRNRDNQAEVLLSLPSRRGEKAANPRKIKQEIDTAFLRALNHSDLSKPLKERTTPEDNIVKRGYVVAAALENAYFEYNMSSFDRIISDPNYARDLKFFLSKPENKTRALDRVFEDFLKMKFFDSEAGRNLDSFEKKMVSSAREGKMLVTPYVLNRFSSLENSRAALPHCKLVSPQGFNEALHGVSLTHVPGWAQTDNHKRFLGYQFVKAEKTNEILAYQREVMKLAQSQNIRPPKNKDFNDTNSNSPDGYDLFLAQFQNPQLREEAKRMFNIR